MKIMLDFAKAVHEAIGIESTRAFIALFTVTGALLGGFVGWLVLLLMGGTAEGPKQ